MNEKTVYGLTLQTPRKMQAGTSGDEPFYFTCAGDGCEAEEIAGLLSTESEYRYGAVVVLQDGGLFHLAVYCESCWPGVVASSGELAGVPR